MQLHVPCRMGVISLHVQPSGRFPIIVCTAIPIANTNCTIETNFDYSIYLGIIMYDLALCCSHLGFVQSKHPTVMRSALANAVNDKCANYHRKTTKTPLKFVKLLITFIFFIYNQQEVLVCFHLSHNILVILILTCWDS